MPLQGEVELSPTGWVRGQTEKILANGTTDGVDINGRPVILLTTRGAKSGKLRKVPLMRVEHDGHYAIVASKGGAPKNPVWYANVKANPEVDLQDGPVTKDYTAREVDGDERSVWWERAVATYADYADYQRKPARQTPVFVLEPRPSCPCGGPVAHSAATEEVAVSSEPVSAPAREPQLLTVAEFLALSETEL